MQTDALLDSIKGWHGLLPLPSWAACPLSRSMLPGEDSVLLLPTVASERNQKRKDSLHSQRTDFDAITASISEVGLHTKTTK